MPNELAPAVELVIVMVGPTPCLFTRIVTSLVVVTGIPVTIPLLYFIAANSWTASGDEKPSAMPWKRSAGDLDVKFLLLRALW